MPLHVHHLRLRHLSIASCYGCSGKFRCKRYTWASNLLGPTGYPCIVRVQVTQQYWLLRFLDNGVCSIAGHDPACRSGHNGFILKPKESEVVDALWKIRFDDDVSRNHSTRNVRVIRAVVAVRHGFRDCTDSGDIRSAGYRVRSENVIDGAKCVLRADEIGKRLVQKIHSDGHVYDGTGSAPGAEAWRHAERRFVQPLV